MTLIELFEPFLKAVPSLLLAVTIIFGFVTGWLVSKGTHQREIEAHKESKKMLKEALSGWREQTEQTKKANSLTQRLIDVLRLRDVIAESPDL